MIELAVLRTVLPERLGSTPIWPPVMTDPLTMVVKVMRWGLEAYGSPSLPARLARISSMLFMKEASSAAAVWVVWEVKT